MNRRYIWILVIAFLFMITTFGFAGPVTIMDPNGQSYANVEDEILKASANPNGLVSRTGSGEIYDGDCRLLSIHAFLDDLNNPGIIGIYNTGPTVQEEYYLGGYPILDLEFEFEIGLSAALLGVYNVPGQVHVDFKGAPFDRGIKVLCDAATSGAIITAIFDY